MARRTIFEANVVEGGQHGMKAQFGRLGTVLSPNGAMNASDGILNPACTRLRDGSLQLYPRMVARGNVSRIGSFRVNEHADATVSLQEFDCALKPEAPYELRTGPEGYGCEDPRVTYIGVIDMYAMAYVAFGPRGPEIALAVSEDGLRWKRLGLLCFRGGSTPFADKDAAFFPEPVRSPNGIPSLALYHRPTLPISVRERQSALSALKALPPESREAIDIGYIPLEAVRSDVRQLCSVEETHRLPLPPANWGLIKVGAGTPPVRVQEGWLSVFHGVDEIPEPASDARLQYCCGLILHDAERLDRILYRSPEPLVVATLPEEIHGTVGYVVFPTAIDLRGSRVFDIYYGMADYRIGRGRLVLET